MFVLSVVFKSHIKKDARNLCLVVGRNVHNLNRIYKEE